MARPPATISRWWTICGTRSRSERPQLKPQLRVKRPPNRAGCCSEKAAYLFRVEWLERFKPGWRNWQTQRTQNPPTFGSWGFDSPSRHHNPAHLGSSESASTLGEYLFFLGFTFGFAACFLGLVP